MADYITYDNDTFKCIDCNPECAEYHDLYVCKEPHYGQDGKPYQLINTNWYGVHKVQPLYSYTNNRGYQHVNLPSVNHGKRCTKLIHRIVFLTWCDELPDNYQDLEINHKSEIRTDNRFDNLELITHQQNSCYGSKMDRQVATLIKNGQTTRVVAFDTDRAKEYHFETIRECARVLGLDRRAIYRCLAGQQRQHHGFLFCREDGTTTK